MRTGSQALAQALHDSAITCVTAFPGSPATTLAQTMESAAAADPGRLRFRWSANENTAISHAFGAAMAGQGSATVMKHVGINVASDALHVMAVVHGLPAPMLVFEGADARPGSSQSAQDNRPLYAGSAQLLVLAPSTPQECYTLTRLGARISRAAGMPVVIRGDARMYKAKGDFQASDADGDLDSAFARWPERGRALSTTARTHGFHLERRREVFQALAPVIEGLVERFDAPIVATTVGIVVAGHLGAEVAKRVRDRGLPGIRLLVEHPLPVRALTELASQCETMIVLEECLPHLEAQVRSVIERFTPASGHRPRVRGRADYGDEAPTGWLEGERLERLLDHIAAAWSPNSEPIADAITPGPPKTLPRLPDLDGRYLQLEEDQPASGYPDRDPRKELFAKLRSLRPTVFIATDPGITGVLALADHGCDVKMHMGGAVPMACGWARARLTAPDSSEHSLAVAVIGDTNLPHSEWLGLIEAAALEDPILAVIVDNGHSEMTQKIVTARPPRARAIASLRALGVTIEEVLASDGPQVWGPMLESMAGGPGLRVLWWVLEPREP